IVADSVLGDEPLPGALGSLPPEAILTFAALLSVGIALLLEVQSRGTDFTKPYISEMLVLGFRARILRHAQRLSVLHHDAKGTADAAYRIMWDASAISAIALDGVIPIAIAVVTAAAMLWVIWTVDPALGVVAVAITPVLFLTTRHYRRIVR